MQPPIIVVMLTLATVSPAVAYIQNKQLESDLHKSDPTALALFPAKGFKDGAAGFFRTHELYVVPDSERAWCQDKSRSILQPGCYVEFVFQGKGLKPKTSRGDPCGLLGRWFQAPGTKNYVPTAGAFFSIAIANDDSEVVDSAIYEKTRPHCK